MYESIIDGFGIAIKITSKLKAVIGFHLNKWCREQVILYLSPYTTKDIYFLCYTGYSVLPHKDYKYNF